MKREVTNATYDSIYESNQNHRRDRKACILCNSKDVNIYSHILHIVIVLGGHIWTLYKNGLLWKSIRVCSVSCKSYD